MLRCTAYTLGEPPLGVEEASRALDPFCDHFARRVSGAPRNDVVALRLGTASAPFQASFPMHDPASARLTMRPIRSFLVALVALAGGGGSALGISSCGDDSTESAPRYTYVSPGATQKRDDAEPSGRRRAGGEKPRTTAPRPSAVAPQTNTTKTVVRTKTETKPTTVTVSRELQRTVTRTVTRTKVVRPRPRTVTRTVSVSRLSQP